MTITLKLDSPVASALQSEAAERGVSVASLTQEIVQRHVRERSTPGSAPTAAALREALTASTRENDELLRRLAQ